MCFSYKGCADALMVAQCALQECNCRSNTGILRSSGTLVMKGKSAMTKSMEKVFSRITAGQ